MKKLRKIIDDAYDFGKLPKGFSLYMFRRLEDIANAIEQGKHPVFFECQINYMLNKCGIITKQYDEINWIVC